MALSTDFTPLSLAVLPRRKRSLLKRLLRLFVIALVLLVIAGAVAWWQLTYPGVKAHTLPATAQSLRGSGGASAERLQAHVRALSENFPGRSFDQPAQLDLASNYIHAQLQALGAAPSRQPVRVDGQAHYHNIVVRLGPKKGEAGGDAPLLVIGAHYDAVRTNGVAADSAPDAHSHTPGADDNASGVAGLLELARMLVAHPPRQPVELVAYTLEEPPQFRTPQMGSYQHAAALANARQPLRMMLSLEMIGYFDDRPASQHYPVPGMTAIYPSAGNFLALIGQLSHFAATRETYAQMLGGAQIDAAGTAPLPVRALSAPASLRGIDYSDHQNYWRFGYPALMVTDTSFMRNPHYHRSTDTWDKLDYRRMAQAVNAVLAVALADPADPGQGVVPRAGDFLR
ncbi:M20/M25/M40 family metallo-hydrolase [Comamonas odontotermitis]|uniref:M20/M25/M40 family metallo-hydrolase n=1 Tax=Comamonas odontotermitis TaxID=379895 RepID=UPI00366F7D72